MVIGGLVGQNAYSNYYADDAAIKKNMLNENVFSENNADWQKAQEKAAEQRKAFDKVQMPEETGAEKCSGWPV